MMCLAEGISKMHVAAISLHLETLIFLIPKFLPVVEITTTKLQINKFEGFEISVKGEIIYIYIYKYIG